MAGRYVRLLLYLGGEIMEGVNGSRYSASAKHIILVDPTTRWMQLIQLLHHKTGIDSMQFKLKVMCRYPVSIVGTQITYTHVPVEGDDILRDVLSIPKFFPGMQVVELYIDQEPIANSSGLEDTQSFVAGTNIGSFTQFMNAASGSVVLGNDSVHSRVFVANNTMMAPSNNTQLAPNMEASSNSHSWGHHISSARTLNYVPQDRDASRQSERIKEIEKIYGNWETSYSLLPRFMCALQASNPGTIVEWRYSKSSIGDYKIFHSVFWAFRPCIDGFKHCRPVITIDGAFQYGKHKEKILIAVGVDAAGHIFPLAFAIIDEESLVNWAWFLDNLRVHIIGDRQGVCLISERIPGILSAIEGRRELQPPLIYHRFCLRNIKANFSQQFKNIPLTELMHRAAFAHQQKKFDAIMNAIKEFNESAYNWLVHIPLHKWTLCYDGGRRYGIMTTNRVESFNSMLKGAKQLPISACVRATFYRLNKIFNKYRSEAEDMIRKKEKWPAIVCEKMLKNEHKSKDHMVTAFIAFIRACELHEVTTGIHGAKGGNKHTVHLNKHSCTCNKLTIYRMPCSHVFKVCESMGHVVFGMIDKFYSSEEMIKTYVACFRLLRDKDYWPPSPFHLVANVNQVNNQSERPRSIRIQNKMDRLRTHRCMACGQHGHLRKHCPNIEWLRERARANS